jgi:hypothetical protein
MISLMDRKCGWRAAWLVLLLAATALKAPADEASLGLEAGMGFTAEGTAGPGSTTSDGSRPVSLRR